MLRSFPFSRHLSQITRSRLLSSQPFNRFAKAAPQKEPYDFKKFCERELTVIEKALSPLLKSNPGYEISRPAPGQLKVFVGDSRGMYSFTADHPLGCLAVISPVSGIHKYGYDQEQDAWVSLDDRHDLRGIITRDFLRHCIGLPQFPGSTRQE